MPSSLRERRAALVATGAVVVLAILLLYLYGSLLISFGIAAVIAYLLLPVVKLLERLMPWRRRRPGLSRVLAISMIFLAFFSLVAGLLILIVPVAARETGEFLQSFPQLVREARLAAEGWIASYEDRMSDESRQRLQEAVDNAGNLLRQVARAALTKTLGVVSASLSLIVGLATAPILIFYLLKDSASVTSALCAPFPAHMRPHVGDLLGIMNRTLGAYLRGQLTLGLVVGVAVAIGLMFLNVPFPIALGLVAGISELVPIIGPWVGGAVAVLVALATVPEQIPWIILLYVVIQILQNAVLTPRIQSNALKLHPVAVILVIVIASQVFGIWGVILGPPLVAMAKDMIVYFLEQWNAPASMALAEDSPEPAVAAGETAPEAVEPPFAGLISRMSNIFRHTMNK